MFRSIYSHELCWSSYHGWAHNRLFLGFKAISKLISSRICQVPGQNLTREGRGWLEEWKKWKFNVDKHQTDVFNNKFALFWHETVKFRTNKYSSDNDTLRFVDFGVILVFSLFARGWNNRIIFPNRLLKNEENEWPIFTFPIVLCLFDRIVCIWRAPTDKCKLNDFYRRLFELHFIWRVEISGGKKMISITFHEMANDEVNFGFSFPSPDYIAVLLLLRIRRILDLRFVNEFAPRLLRRGQSLHGFKRIHASFAIIGARRNDVNPYCPDIGDDRHFSFSKRIRH